MSQNVDNKILKFPLESALRNVLYRLRQLFHTVTDVVPVLCQAGASHIISLFTTEPTHHRLMYNNTVPHSQALTRTYRNRVQRWELQEYEEFAGKIDSRRPRILQLSM
jgi:hypothetical protein